MSKKNTIKIISILSSLLIFTGCAPTKNIDDTKEIEVRTEESENYLFEEEEDDIEEEQGEVYEPQAIQEEEVQEQEVIEEVNQNIQANSNTMKYHNSSCHHGDKISDENRVQLSSAEEAESLGYEACKVCGGR